jgi:hypothetical protein
VQADLLTVLKVLVENRVLLDDLVLVRAWIAWGCVQRAMDKKKAAVC